MTAAAVWAAAAAVPRGCGGVPLVARRCRGAEERQRHGRRGGGLQAAAAAAGGRALALEQRAALP